MFDFLGKMFGTDKAMSKTIDTIANGLDKLVYTSEEKADDAKLERQEYRSFIIKWQEATQGQNLTRRFLAFIITMIWLMQYVAMMGLAITSVWIDEPRLLETASVIGGFAESMNGAMMLILGFYFAAMHFDKVADAALNKFGNSSKIKDNKKE